MLARLDECQKAFVGRLSSQWTLGHRLSGCTKEIRNFAERFGVFGRKDLPNLVRFASIPSGKHHGVAIEERMKVGEPGARRAQKLQPEPFEFQIDIGRT